MTSNKREIERHNPVAKDLRSQKYHQRIVKSKKRYDRKNSDRDYE